MIELTYRQLRNPEFLAVTQRIYRGRMNYRSAKRVSEVLLKLQEMLTQSNADFDLLAKEHMVKTPAGDFMPKEGADHADAINEYLDKKITLPVPPIDPSELFGIEISPFETELLKGLVNE